MSIKCVATRSLGMGSPPIDRPSGEGEEGEPQDAEADGVAGPVAVDWGLEDPLTAADEWGVRHISSHRIGKDVYDHRGELTIHLDFFTPFIHSLQS